MSSDKSISKMSSIIITFTLILLITYLLVRKWFRTNGFPIVGHLPMIKSRPDLIFSSWVKKFGPVFTVMMGNRKCLVINGFDAAKQALVNHATEFADRPDFTTFSYISEGKSMAFGKLGLVWKRQRAAVKSVINHLVQRRRAEMEEAVIREADDLVISASSSSDLPCPKAVYDSVASLIYGFCFGEGERANEDPRFQKYLIDDAIFTKLMSTGMSVADFIPWTARVNPFRTYLAQFADVQNSLLNNVRRKMNDLELHHIYGQPRNIGDDLLDLSHKEAYNGSYTEDHIRLLPVELIGAGHSTLSIALRWAFHFMTVFPEYQRRVHSEIDEKFGSEKIPTWEDRERLPLCEAVLMESMRLGTIQPFLVPHAISEDCKFHGLHLEKGTLVMINIRTVLRDPSLWRDPDSFLPERFFEADTEKIDPKRVAQAPVFGLGKRKCPGEMLARIQMFLIFVRVMQRCRVLWKGNNPPEIEGLIQFSAEPFDQFVFAEAR